MNASEPILAPHSVEVEEALLGALLISPEALLDVVTYLKPDDFFILRHGWIFEAMLRLHSRHEAIDYLTVTEELRQQSRLDDIGGAAYLTLLINRTPSSLYAETYGRVIERAALRRRLIDAGTQIATLAQSEDLDITAVLDEANARLAAVTTARADTSTASMRQVASDVYDEVEAARQTKGTGLPTGFTDLDLLMGGLQKSDLIIVAGRPGMGKTSWLLSIAMHAARRRGRLALFSLEMSKGQVGQRLVAIETGVSTEKQRTGRMDDRDFALFTEGIGRIADLQMWVDDTPNLTMAQMAAKARRLYAEYGLDLIVVDYLQLMAGERRSGSNREQEISSVSRGLKQLARELNVPVVAAAQLSRAVEQRADKRPLLSDLRESGSLEQDSDVVIFLYRDGYYNENTSRPNQTDVIIAKHRNGPTGTISLYFRRELTQFSDLKKNDPINLGGF